MLDAHHARRCRHRAGLTPLVYAAHALLSFLPRRERPRPTERPNSPPLGAPGAMDLRPTDPRTIGVHQILGRLGSDSHGVLFLAGTPSGELVTIKQLHSPAENDRTSPDFTS